MTDKKYDFSNVKIKDDLAKQIDELVSSELGRKYGFRSRAYFVSRACRELLRKYQPQYQVVPRFIHVNTYDDHATIRDNKIGREINIYFKNGGVAYCDHCKETNCEHIDYTLTSIKVKKE